MQLNTARPKVLIYPYFNFTFSINSNQIPIITSQLHQSLKPIHTQMSPQHIHIQKASPYQTTLIYQHSGSIPKPTVLFNSQHKQFTNPPMRIVLQARSDGFQKKQLNIQLKDSKKYSQRHKTQIIDQNENIMLGFTKQNSHRQQRTPTNPQPPSMIKRIISKQQTKNQQLQRSIQQYHDFKSPNKIKIIQPIIKKSSEPTSKRQSIQNSGYKEQSEINKFKRTQEENELVDKYRKKNPIQQTIQSPIQQLSESKKYPVRQQVIPQQNITSILPQISKKESQFKQNSNVEIEREQQNKIIQQNRYRKQRERERPTYSHRDIGKTQRSQLLETYRSRQKITSKNNQANQDVSKHKNLDDSYTRKRRQQRRRIYERSPENQQNKLNKKQSNTQKQSYQQSKKQMMLNQYNIIIDPKLDKKPSQKYSQKQQNNERQQFVTFMPKDKKTLQQNFTPTKQNNQQEDDFLNVKSMQYMLQRKLTKQKQLKSQKSKAALQNHSECVQPSPKNLNHQLNVADLQMKLFKFEESRVKHTNKASENGSPKFQFSEVRQVKVEPFVQQITSHIVDSHEFVEKHLKQYESNRIRQNNPRSVSPNYLYESRKDYYYLNEKPKIDIPKRKNQFGSTVSPSKFSNFESKKIADEIDKKYEKYVTNRERRDQDSKRESQKSRRVNFDKYRNRNYERGEIDLVSSNYDKYTTEEDLSWITEKYKGKNLRNTQNFYSKEQSYLPLSTNYRSTVCNGDLNYFIYKK